MKKKILTGLALAAVIIVMVFNLNFSQIETRNSLKLENLLALNVAAAENAAGYNYSGYTTSWIDNYPLKLKRLVYGGNVCHDEYVSYWSGYAFCNYK